MKLLFVYNAKSDPLNMIFDFAHKIISPKTYACDLCHLTHGNFGERKEWTVFLQASSIDLDFYHSDEFEKEFETKFKYPIVLKSVDSHFEVLLDAQKISGFTDVNDLIESLNHLV